MSKFTQRQAKAVLAVSVTCAVAACCSLAACSGETGRASEHPYSTIRPQIQNAVTAYMVENSGQRPLVNTSGGAQYDIGGTMIDVINMCDIVSHPSVDLLRTVPICCAQFPGADNDNFDAPGCNLTPYGIREYCIRVSEYEGGLWNEHWTKPSGGAYVWLVDPAGNVYSVCDSDLSGAIEYYENCDGLSGCENASKEVWCYDCPSFWEQYNEYIIIYSIIGLLALISLLISLWLIRRVNINRRTRDMGGDSAD